jgi:hypothetical protein
MLLASSAPDTHRRDQNKSLAQASASALSRHFGFTCDPIRLALFWLAVAPGRGESEIETEGFTLSFEDWSEDDWRALLDCAQQETMLSWIAHRLTVTSLGCPPSLLSEFSESIRIRKHWNRYYGLAALELCKTLAAEGISVSILKGAPLGALLYGDMALRDVRDIDLLVDEGNLLRTAEVFEAQGFKCQVSLHWVGSHHFRRNFREISFHKLGGAIEIDLHWRVNNNWVGDGTKLDHQENGPPTNISLGDKAIQWFSIDSAVALCESNIINAHHVEMKASVDRLLLEAHIARMDAGIDLGACEAAPSEAQSLVEKTQHAITFIAHIARLSEADTARDLFGDERARAKKSGFVALWSRHMRRTHSLGQLAALASAAFSPALKDYMLAHHASTPRLFASALRRKIFGAK